MKMGRLTAKILLQCPDTLRRFVDGSVYSCRDPSVQFPVAGEESELLSELISFLQWTGLEAPRHQVYSPAPRSVGPVAMLRRLS